MLLDRRILLHTAAALFDRAEPNGWDAVTLEISAILVLDTMVINPRGACPRFRIILMITPGFIRCPNMPTGYMTPRDHAG
jgi:hypothetical protein